MERLTAVLVLLAAAVADLADPYTDPSILVSVASPRVDFYNHSWRGWQETRPARALLDGVGLVYNLHTTGKAVDHARIIPFLASKGFRRMRVEVGWNSLAANNSALEDVAGWSAVFSAMAAAGVTPIVLLNANDGGPQPMGRAFTGTLAAAAAANATSIVVDAAAAAAITVGYSGFTCPGGSHNQLNKYIVTAVGAGGLIELSQPLELSLPAGSALDFTTFQWLPLHAVGSPQLEATLAAWVQYVEVVATFVASFGLSFDAEVWNEMTFGSRFVAAPGTQPGINNYYATPPAPPQPDVFQQGGAIWELTNRTVAALKARHPAAARVIYGFSNTAFQHVAVERLAPQLDGQSFHPYSTGRYVVGPDPNGLPNGNPPGSLVGPGQPANGTVTWVSGLSTFMFAVRYPQIPREFLIPAERNHRAPPGVAPGAFSYYFTEHGTCPASDALITDAPTALAYKAKAALGVFAFWLGKGITAITLYAAFDGADTCFGLMAGASNVTHFDPPASTPALDAVGRFTAAFVAAEAAGGPVTTPRNLTVSWASSEAPPLWPANASGPAMPAVNSLYVQPWQAGDHAFLLTLFHAPPDARPGMPAARVQVALAGLGPSAAVLAASEPNSGATVPVALTYDAGTGTATLTLEAGDELVQVTLGD